MQYAFNFANLNYFSDFKRYFWNKNVNFMQE